MSKRFVITDWARRIFAAHDKLEAAGHSVKRENGRFVLDGREILSDAELVVKADKLNRGGH